MLSEIYIRNFAIIDELRVQFSFGFNVLTGETGAGKSILLDSLSMLLGGRADSSMVRTGSEKAILEATFELTPANQTAILPILADQSLEGDEADVIFLGRELQAAGRSVCRINGRVVPLSLLRQVGEFLVDIHGQGEHLSLLKAQAHLPLLDAYGQLQSERQKLSTEVETLRGIQKELNALQENARMLAQREDMLRFQSEEISAAQLEVGEEERLRSERTRLANAEQLMSQANQAAALLNGMDDNSLSVSDLLGNVERAIAQLAKLDPEQEALLEQTQGLTFQISELAGVVSDYQENLEYNPSRLNEVEGRLELLNQLKRKYGAEIADVIAAGEKAQGDLDDISHSEEQIATLMAEEESKLRLIGEMADALSKKRQTAGITLADAIERELAELKMDGARFSVEFKREEDEDGVFVGENRLAFDRNGIDKAEFLISTNPGEPLKPMAKVASGGETARLMLALKTALAQVDATTTLIFDEIDQGIGGRIGSTVGKKLWGLTQRGDHQVIVVTHLPQLAGFGDIHLQVRKGLKNERTVTDVRRLDESGRIAELGAMLGTGADEARIGAGSILREVAGIKSAYR